MSQRIDRRGFLGRVAAFFGAAVFAPVTRLAGETPPIESPVETLEFDPFLIRNSFVNASMKAVKDEMNRQVTALFSGGGLPGA